MPIKKCHHEKWSNRVAFSAENGWESSASCVSGWIWTWTRGEWIKYFFYVHLKIIHVRRHSSFSVSLLLISPTSIETLYMTFKRNNCKEKKDEEAAASETRKNLAGCCSLRLKVENEKKKKSWAILRFSLLLVIHRIIITAQRRRFALSHRWQGASPRERKMSVIVQTIKTLN